jgi:hypothetical protein
MSFILYIIIGFIVCIVWNKYVPYNADIISIVLFYPLFVTLYAIALLFNYIKKVGQ